MEQTQFNLLIVVLNVWFVIFFWILLGIKNELKRIRKYHEEKHRDEYEKELDQKYPTTPTHW
jgi:hypothetical protein